VARASPDVAPATHLVKSSALHAGFHSYETVLTGGDTGYSISTWENQQQATEAVKAGEAWVKANIADAVVSAQNHVGKVAFSHRASGKEDPMGGRLQRPAALSPIVVRRADR